MGTRSNRAAMRLAALAAVLLVGTSCIEGHGGNTGPAGEVLGPTSIGRDPAAISEISGFVLDDVTWNPLAGVRVFVGDLQTTTASDGSYRLSGIQALVVLLEATKDGYERSTSQVPLAIGSNTFRIFLKRPGA